MASKKYFPTILITGGAGYIGSHTSDFLAKKGYNVIVLDTLCHNQDLPGFFQEKKISSQANFFEKNKNDKIILIKKDFADKKILHQIFSQNKIDVVIHFAALIEVGESVKSPMLFYQNNVVKTIQLLESMIEHKVKKIVFSSSCAVYGAPKKVPILETHPKNPISPYGKNKLIIEMLLQDLQRAHGLEFISLRYFNAAGAIPEKGLGEQHKPETHLIPLLLQAAHEKKVFYIFGNDHKTFDGSCVRDFLHVQDLANAHWRAVQYLKEQKQSDFFNLGTGNGYSVKQMIETVQKICKKEIKTIIAKKREGDPPTLVANATKANTVLNWKPQYSDLEKIIRDANKFYLLKVDHKTIFSVPFQSSSEILKSH